MLDARLFEDIIQNYRDNHWILENEQAIFDAIENDLKSENTLDVAIQCLVIVFPRMFELLSKDVKLWGKLIRLAFNKVVSAEDDFIFPHADENGIHSMYVVQIREAPSQLPTKTKRKKRELVHPQAFYEMYLTLLMMKFYEGKINITPDIMMDMLTLARFVNDPYLANKTYQTIAYIHNERGEYEKARTFAEKAWDYWASIPSPLESFLTGYALSVAYSHLGQTELTSQWQDTTRHIHDHENAYQQRDILEHLHVRF